MTALSGGDKLENKPSSMSSVFARSSVTGGETSPRVRSFEQLFPSHGDAADVVPSWSGIHRDQQPDEDLWPERTALRVGSCAPGPGAGHVAFGAGRAGWYTDCGVG